MKPYITCEGTIRGSCGQRHETLRDAAECMRRDDAAAVEAGEDYDRELVVRGSFGKRVIPAWLVGWDIVGDETTLDRAWPMERVIAFVCNE